MAVFEYTARTRQGDTRAGTVEAPTKDSALESLHKNDLIVISIAEQRRRNLFELHIGGGVKQKDIVLFSRQLATLLEAQIPLVQTLRTLADETANQKLKTAINEILSDVTGGMALSTAMARHPSIFTAFYTNLVRAAEEAGKFQEVFGYLADYLERSYYLATRARNALIYPAFICVAFLAVLTVMLVIVIPNLAKVFQESNQELPLFTKIVIGFSFFLQRYGLVLVALMVAGGIATWRWSRTEPGKLFFHKLQLELPIFGVLYQKIYVVRLTDNLRTLITSGIPLIRALMITSDVVGNRVYQKSLNDAIESVKRGGAISAAFEKNEGIPRMVSQMIKVGETSGRLDFILGNIAKFYQREVDSLLDNLVALIEPLLIMGLGLAVAVLVSAVLIPLYNLVGSF